MKTEEIEKRRKGNLIFRFQTAELDFLRFRAYNFCDLILLLDVKISSLPQHKKFANLRHGDQSMKRS